MKLLTPTIQPGVCRFITHDRESTHYWDERRFALKHLAMRGSDRGATPEGLLMGQLYREVEPGRYGKGQLVV